MIDILIWLCVGTFLLFAFVVAFGAPFLPTLKPQVTAALDLIDLRPGQTLLELGSGDGRVLLAAAGRGFNVIGYELNPVLVLYSRWRTRRFGKQVRVVWGNFWKAKLPATDGIFVFLLPKYMKRLDNIVVQKYPDQKIKLVSFAFKIPGRRPEAANNGLYLYQY